MRQGNVEFNERAWTAGAFLSDGCSNVTDVGSRRIRMIGDNESVISSFSKKIEKLSGEKTTSLV